MEEAPTRPSATIIQRPASPSSSTHRNGPNNDEDDKQITSGTTAVSEEQRDSESQASAPTSNYHASYIIPLVIIITLLVSPWILFAVVWSHDGIVASPHFSVLVRDNQQTVDFLATHFGSLFAAIVGLLFSTAIIRYSQKWIFDRDEVEVFVISVFTSLRTQQLPWGIKDLYTLASRWQLILVVVACVYAFSFVPSGISALLNPISFNKTGPLTGTELNFTSTAPDCVAWLQIPRIQPTCNWFSYQNLHYTSCLAENQLVDALEAGRGNILSLLSNNTQSQVFSQLGSSDGLRFLGPIRGVLPLGPNGVPAFNTLSPSRLSNSALQAGIMSYQYTLNLQGLSSQIKCEYSLSSPISFNLSAAGIYQTLGSCPPGQDVFPAQTLFIHIVSDYTLGMWACGLGKSNRDGSFNSYLLYLRGYRQYDSNIGNITCTLSPVMPAVFSVTFSNRTGVFSVSQPTQLSTNSPSDLIRESIKAIASLVSEAQSFASNEVAETVITFGVKSFGLSPNSQDPKYLHLFEAMLQGVLEYEATYVRLIYTANNIDTSAAPHSCIRKVSGSALYLVTGWHYDKKTVAFLLPMTLLNLASLTLLLLAMHRGEKVLYSTDPTDPKSLLLATTELGEDGKKVKITLERGGKYNFGRELWDEIKKPMTNMMKEGGKTLGTNIAQDEAVETMEKFAKKVEK